VTGGDEVDEARAKEEQGGAVRDSNHKGRKFFAGEGEKGGVLPGHNVRAVANRWRSGAWKFTENPGWRSEALATGGHGTVASNLRAC